jgi:hypothetical protein
MAAEFDFAKLRAALEESDARSLLELYDDNGRNEGCGSESTAKLAYDLGRKAQDRGFLG